VNAASVVSNLLEESYDAQRLQSLWQQDKEGDYVRVDKERGTAAHISRGRLVQQIPVQGDIWQSIKQWMGGQPHMLSIWSEDGYHNVTLQDGQGGELGTTA